MAIEAMLAWPSRIWTIRMSIPFSISHVASRWRRRYGVTRRLDAGLGGRDGESIGQHTLEDLVSCRCQWVLVLIAARFPGLRRRWDPGSCPGMPGRSSKAFAVEWSSRLVEAMMCKGFLTSQRIAG